MKRTAMKRSTTKKDGSPQKLAAHSPKKVIQNKTYTALKKIYTPESCARCGASGEGWNNLEPHHIAERTDLWRMMLIVPLCNGCHEWVHANGQTAREDGWLIRVRTKQWRDAEDFAIKAKLRNER